MIVIVDYGMGNLLSIRNMISKAGGRSVISSNSSVIGEAEALILPGVGSFDAGMNNLRERGLVEPLTRAASHRKVPVLGLCLGMQLMTLRSEEGHTSGLGWFQAETVRFRPERGEAPGLKVPHMGWNTVTFTRPSGLDREYDSQPRFFFVHSYHLDGVKQDEVLALTTYGYRFPSAVQRGNLMGVQFHPEKSHRFGMQLLKNFANMSGSAA